MATAHYPESIWSPYHKWFVELGYPLLDINEYRDGSWEIIQWMKYPVIPAEAPFQAVLTGKNGGIQNTEINKGFIRQYLKKLDMYQKDFWDDQDQHEKEIDVEHESRLRHEDEIATRATEAITRNPDLMERIARNGLVEMRPERIFRHIPSHHFR
mgnify:CR=1 FL=1